MPRFYCPVPLSSGSELALPANAAHHVQVLRLGCGDEVTLFDGTGGTFAARVLQVEKKRVTVKIGGFSDAEAELPYAVTLAQALPEASKMDWIVEKAVELGVTAIQPLSAQRCVVRLSADRAEKKQAHWQGIIVAASEQCGRNRLAQLALPADFGSWARQRRDVPVLLLSPRATTSLSDWARRSAPQNVFLAIGPEGGFTPAEEELALASGACALGVGPRVLRTETAGLAAVAALNGIWGGM